MADPKELDFFVGRSGWLRGRAWYEAHFDGAGSATAVGEASPNYTKRHDDAEVARRISELLPGARLIYVVRHPIERMVSMYRQVVADGLEHRPAAVAFATNSDYVKTSLYAWQLEPYLAAFPPGQLLVITSEALRGRRAATVARVFEFLGVDAAWRPPGLAEESQSSDRLRVARPGAAHLARLPGYRRLLERSWRLRAAHLRLTTRPAPAGDPDLPPHVAARLRDVFAPDVARLYPLVGGEFDGWGIA